MQYDLRTILYFQQNEEASEDELIKWKLVGEHGKSWRAPHIVYKQSFYHPESQW